MRTPTPAPRAARSRSLYRHSQRPLARRDDYPALPNSPHWPGCDTLRCRTNHIGSDETCFNGPTGISTAPVAVAQRAGSAHGLRPELVGSEQAVAGRAARPEPATHSDGLVR